MRAWGWVATVVAGCAPTPFVCALPDAEAPPQPNVLVLVLDDVGIEQLAPWGVGTEPAVTPALDCLCAAGLRFDRVWAAPFCTPGRVALLSGRHPRRLGIGRYVSPGAGDWEMPSAWRTVGEVAQDAGYSTAFVGKWHVGSYEGPSGLDHPNVQGFDHFSGTMGNLGSHAENWPEGHPTYEGWEHLTDGTLSWREGYATSATIDDALDAVDGLAEPWLLVVSLHAAHAPLHRPPGRLRSEPLGWHPTARERFQAMIAAADTEIGRLLTDLDPGVLARTQVWTTSDNGSPEHGLPDDLAGTVGKGSLAESGVRVPLMVTGAGVGASGAHTSSLVSLLDVFPTLIDVMGAAPSDSDGLSLQALLADPERAHRAVLYADLTGADGRVHRAVRDDAHKLVIRADGSESLYVLGPGLEQQRIDTVVPGSLRYDLAAFTGRYDAEP